MKFWCILLESAGESVVLAVFDRRPSARASTASLRVSLSTVATYLLLIMLRALVLAAAAAAAAALNCSIVNLGCFNDQAGPRVVNDEVASDSTTLTAASCAQLCFLKGRVYAGLTSHTTPSVAAFCYCGNDPDPAAVPAPAADCSLSCPGGGAQPCGNNYRMSFYNVSCGGPPPPPPGPPLNGTAACTQPETRGLPFCNMSLSFVERTRDLVARVELYDIGPQLTARNAPAIPYLGIPPYYWGVNFVHGVTNAVTGGDLCVNNSCVTIWPSGPGLGASWNSSSWYTLGATSADEIRGLNNKQWGPAARAGGMDGLDSWGPTINLIRDPRWGRNQETASEDPYMNGVFATQIVRGLQGDDPQYLKVAATLKHFAVYSLEHYFDAASNFTFTRENVNNVVSPFDLADSYYPHFQAAVSPVSTGGGAAAGVMMAMNAVNGVPCLANSQLIELLRTWGGPNTMYITTDGGNMIDSMIALEPAGHSYCPFHAPPCTRDEGVTAAVQAGSDVADGSEYDESLYEAVLDGNLTLGEAQQRLFYTMLIRMRLGLFDDPQPFRDIGLERVGAADTRAAALLAAKESLVLLSAGGGALPLRAGPIAVLGFAANKTSALISNYVSGNICPGGGVTCYTSIAESLTALGRAVSVAPGCTSATNCPADLVATAVAAAGVAGTRTVLTLGLDQSLESEGRDRQNVSLPFEQAAFVDAVLAAAHAADNDIVVVIVHGGAVALPTVKAAGVAVLDAFYPGPFGGEAIAATLVGDYNPGGRLPYTVYDEAYDVAVSMPDMRVGATARTYRYHADSSPGGAPLWRFGEGYSYTTFTTAWAPAPGALALSPAAPTATVTVRVTNAGAVDGDEVVQLYFVPLAVASPQPPFLALRALMSFARVRVAAGASVDVPLVVDAAKMALTLSDGTRGPMDGEYSVVVSTGDGVAELEAGATLAGF